VPGFGVIINPHAGENRREQDRLPRLREIIGDAGIVHAPQSLDDLETLMRELHRRGIDVLAVCGGDGSFFRSLSAMVRIYAGAPLPKFLPLRAGSMNTIARSVGCRHGSPERVLGHAIADYRRGRPFETTERGLIAVDDRHYGFMVGAGAIVSFLQVYYAAPGRGPVAAAKLFARLVLSGLVGGTLVRGILQGFEGDVDCDGERVPHRVHNLFYASSITDIGLGFHATYLATRKRGFFHLLSGRLTVKQLVPRLYRLRRGWPLDVPGLYDNLAREVRVEFARPTHYMIDGDVLEAVPRIALRSGPRLTIIRK
jgi:diacylglycerol kinase family enzyme